MTQQIINIGSGELAGDGESIRSAFVKTNANFTELYTGLVGPTGPAGLTGPTGPMGPGADQSLNTFNDVTFNSLAVSTTAYFGNTISSVTDGSLANIKLRNNSIALADQNIFRYLRQRGNTSTFALLNQSLGSIQWDMYQPGRGFAEDYDHNRLYPGIRYISNGSNINSNGTRAQILNRIPFSPTSAFPGNVNLGNSTDTNVIASLTISPTLTESLSNQFNQFTPFQGYNAWAGTNTGILNGIYGLQRLLPVSTYAGPSYSRILSVGAGDSQLYISSRADNQPYWLPGLGGMTTSTNRQIDFISEGSITSSNLTSGSVVKGANLQLNSIRYEYINKTVPRSIEVSAEALWTTSTKAGDVLGTISFQGALDGASDVVLTEGRVDGVLIRAYAKNDWFGTQINTSTNVTFENNQSALRIEIANTTTIGGLDPGHRGVQQKYKNVFEIDVSTATFNTDLFVRNGLQFLDGSIQTTGFDFSTSATAPSLMPGRLWFNSVEGRLYINYNNTWVEASPTQIDPSAIRYNNLNQIELPPGGDIVDSDGNSVLGGGGPGLGTYSFDGSILQSDEALIRTNDSDLTLESDSDVFVKSSAGGNTWQFGIDGSLTFPGNGKLNVKSTAPTHSYGVTGDKAGMIAFDGDFFYYCKQDYVNNTTDIWVRVVWTSSNW